MSEVTRADDAVEKETQSEPMPSSEQKTSKPVEPEAAAPAKEVSQSAETGKEGELELPEGAPPRTSEQFEKLRSQLRKERGRRQYLEEVFGSISPPGRPQAPPPSVEVGEFVTTDPNTGERLVDVERLNKALSGTQQRAARAEQLVQNYIEQQQTREALTAYPQLDRESDKFDSALHKRTRAFLLDSMASPEDYNGRQLSFKEAADLASGSDAELVKAAEEAGAKKALEQLTPKEQASLEATGRSDRRTGTADLETLRNQTRYGGESGLEAVVKRLSKIPPVKK